jgi:hypothetical protein
MPWCQRSCQNLPEQRRERGEMGFVLRRQGVVKDAQPFQD